MWRNPQLLSVKDNDHHHGVEDAQHFASLLSRRLTIDPKFVLPGYEDSLYQLWRESSVPINLDPLKADLSDPLERRSLAAALSRGLHIPVGYALPLRWNHKTKTWQSMQWVFRREHMFLLPGDSPMGLRLPLDSLQWTDAKHRDISEQRSLFEPLPPLGDYYGEVARS